MADGVTVTVLVRKRNDVQLTGVISEVRTVVFVADPIELSSIVLVCNPVTSVVVKPHTNSVVGKLRKFSVVIEDT